LAGRRAVIAGFGLLFALPGAAFVLLGAAFALLGAAFIFGASLPLLGAPLPGLVSLPPARRASEGLKGGTATPASVTIAVMSRAGVTSNAGFTA
jgi:hypothetical protein